jgi:uncharacterized protein (DUF1330 family)
MSVYFIVSYDIDDSQAYEAYVQGVIPLLQKYQAEILVADYEVKAIEGQPCGVYVVLRFASEEAAMKFYNDPDYEPVKQIRLSTTSNGTAVLAREFVPPSN